ncbi:MAG: hypothetical protein AB7V26_07945 [Lysobacterales bacterium]
MNLRRLSILLTGLLLFTIFCLLAVVIVFPKILSPTQFSLVTKSDVPLFLVLAGFVFFILQRLTVLFCDIRGFVKKPFEITFHLLGAFFAIYFLVSNFLISPMPQP